MYQQYYLDANRTTNQLNDDWSKTHWFGGVDPNTITYNNDVTPKKLVSQLPLGGNLPFRPTNYAQSHTGLTVNIRNIADSYQNYKITAYRIKEGGRLDRMTPEEVTTSVKSSLVNGVLTITDTGAVPSTVTLYTIELTN